MNFKAIPLAFVVGLTLTNCASTSSTASASGKLVPVSRVPSYVSILNLSGESLELTLDGGKFGNTFEDGAISAGFIASPKQHKLAGKSGKGDIAFEFKCEGGKFSTIVIQKVNGKIECQSMVGGSSILPESGIICEYINLTDTAMDFSGLGANQLVKPMSSVSESVSEGSHTIKIKNVGSVDFKANVRDIWGIAVFRRDGKLSAQSVLLKAPLRVSAAGTSPMG